VSSLTDRPVKKIFTIDIPSELGFEKIPIAAVAIVAKKMGFDPERIENLKTVMGEAVTNAIEHGNLLNIVARVQIVLTAEPDSLVMSVIDEGQQPIPTTWPSRRERADWRGWGLGWIKEFADEVSLEAAPGRNEIKMIAYLNKEA
jgi:serine/threonine-protein kinase RsbW